MKAELRAALPGGPRMPPIVQLLAAWTRPASSFTRLRARYGTRATVELPFQPPIVVLSDPDDIRDLFTAPPDAIHPGEGARILEPIVGRLSLILLDEDVHLEHRRLLLPAFHGDRMRELVTLMRELTARELDGWPVDAPVALHPRLQRLTLEIILRAVFGLERGERLDTMREALTEVLAFSESPLSITPWAHRYAAWLPSLRRFRAVRARADELIYAQIAERRAEANPNSKGHGDVLAMLLAARHEDGSEMDERELRDELMTALVAGHETTASQLAWALVHLARDDRVVDTLHAGVASGDGDAYLTATVQEILRLRPVLPNAEPRLTKQTVRIGGVEYPRGVVLMASTHLVHHDPSLYPEPYAFRPERFLETDGNGGRSVVTPGTYTWIPFGGGRRRCLGASFAIQEMKIVLAEVVRRFTIEPVGAVERTARRSITHSPGRRATVVLRPRA